MTKRDKLVESLRTNPTNVRFEVIQSILLDFGFKERQPKGGSSHYTYTLNAYILTVPKHKPFNKVYVKRVISIIDELSIK